VRGRNVFSGRLQQFRRLHRLPGGHGLRGWRPLFDLRGRHLRSGRFRDMLHLRGGLLLHVGIRFVHGLFGRHVRPLRLGQLHHLRRGHLVGGERGLLHQLRGRYLLTGRFDEHLGLHGVPGGHLVGGGWHL